MQRLIKVTRTDDRYAEVHLCVDLILYLYKWKESFFVAMVGSSEEMPDIEVTEESYTSILHIMGVVDNGL